MRTGGAVRPLRNDRHFNLQLLDRRIQAAAGLRRAVGLPWSCSDALHLEPVRPAVEALSHRWRGDSAHTRERQILDVQTTA